MFDNATMFMMFILLCFAGLLVMFYFVLRGMEELARGMRDEHAALASGLRTLEARVNELARAQRAAAAGLPPTPHAGAGADAFDEPVGQYHVQYGTGPDARTDTGYGTGDDPLYGLVHEDVESSLPGGLAMDFEEPVELVDRQPDGVSGLGRDGVSGLEYGGTAAAPREADLHAVELPSLDLTAPAGGTSGASGVAGASRGRAAGLDTSALDPSSLDAFGDPDRAHDAHEPHHSPDTGGTGLLSFGDDEAAYREARERRAESRASRGKGGLPELKLDD
ncbi:hypothetical protein [Nitratidesulfovibrio sp. SRB-5]|uniref:hypothetical protein n=1 Tax=Nitratidesulfovibrio sp. SRB-5 TaxID=2872636 RepID=UPI0010257204|nr:hypothetical protein [Nitratidesulfovibrio sp. SRB-5]MBZ2171593.1 hypothetical protein [Nitratidesulfovibrio sp. SRB-5]RXF78096.1 hypothetical protein EKK70_03390 [Desulfovibrio sp. DS-1]